MNALDYILANYQQEKYQENLDSKGLSFNEGKIIDASFVEAPRQRNTREENERIKSGNGKDLWNDNPHKKCHKDTDARWTKKRGEKHYGYKLHAKAATALTCLVYNIFRYVQINKYQPKLIASMG